MTATVTISCVNCRSNKLAAGDSGSYWLYSCRYRNRGLATRLSETSPCDKWCPAKSDVRLWLARVQLEE